MRKIYGMLRKLLDVSLTRRNKIYESVRFIYENMSMLMRLKHVVKSRLRVKIKFRVSEYYFLFKKFIHLINLHELFEK